MLIFDWIGREFLPGPGKSRRGSSRQIDSSGWPESVESHNTNTLVISITDARAPTFLEELPVLNREKAVTLRHLLLFRDFMTCVITFSSLNMGKIKQTLKSKITKNFISK
jgi:hypothetical protein